MAARVSVPEADDIASSFADTVSLLAAVLPEKGPYFVASKGERGFRPEACGTVEAVARAARSASERGAESYFALAGFRDPAAGRKAENATSLRAFWLDIDTRESHAAAPYADRGEARKALGEFRRAAGLPAPWIVDSGGGLHVYWPLVDAIGPAEWREGAAALRRATDVLGLRADHSRTGDPASILRPPGTLNRKRPGAPREVYIRRRGEARPYVDILRALRKASGGPRQPVEAPLQSIDDPVPEHILRAFGQPDGSLQGPARPGWFDRLSPEDRDAALGEMLARPGIVALADLPDGAPSPNWRDVLAACARSGAPNAESLCRAWAATSRRYKAEDFESRFSSFKQSTTAGGITVGTLIRLAEQGGWDPAPWKARAQGGEVIELPTKTPAPDLDSLNYAALHARPIPHRQWLVSPILVRGSYSMLVATGGSGKTALCVALALAMVTGRRDVAGFEPVRAGRVLLVNAEDAQDELLRRIAGACQRHGITPQAIGDRLMVAGADNVALHLNRAGENGAAVDVQGFARLDSMIAAHGADLVILDPLGSLLPGGVNDGAAASAVAGGLVRLAVARNCALLLAHHVSKAALRAGDGAEASAGLGSQMWTNHSRVVLNLSRPTESQATAAGLSPTEAADVVLLHHSKANLSRAQDASWYRFATVRLDNAAPPDFPHGDAVGTLEPFVPGTAASLFSDPALKACLDAVAQGTGASLPLKPSGRAGAQDYRPAIAQAIGPYFAAEPSHYHVTLAPRALAVLQQRGWIVTRSITIPRTGGGRAGGGKAVDGLFVDWSATPWAGAPGDGPFRT